MFDNGDNLSIQPIKKETGQSRSRAIPDTHRVIEMCFTLRVKKGCIPPRIERRVTTKKQEKETRKRGRERKLETQKGNESDAFGV